MKKHFFALLAGLCIAGAVYPQGTDTAAIPTERWTQQAFADSVESQNKYFAVTFAGKVLPGSAVGYNKKSFIVDTLQVDPGTIAFYKNATGFYANANMAHNQTKSVFPHRVSKGRMNLYEREAMCISPMYGSPAPGLYGGGGPSTKTVLYYNAGLGELKLANYKNLRSDLASNPESVKHLDRYHSLAQTQAGFVIAGAALIVGGFATLIHKVDNAGENPPPYGPDNPRSKDVDISGNVAAMLLGVGCTTVSYFISLNKPEHLQLALDAYNR